MGRGLGRRTVDLVNKAVAILEEIKPASVRAVCYRLFTGGVIASMTKSETNKVSRALTTAREQGLVPWSWLVDETREAERVNAFENPEEFAQAAIRSYRRNRWAAQPERVEIWSEKGTIRGTLAPVLQMLGVTFRVFHGYASATSIHDVAVESLESAKPLTAFYVGDWDPSGLHMSEVDIPGRLAAYGGQVQVIRLALDIGDTFDTDLPSFSVETKTGDPRYTWYRQRFGTKCFELDALSPVVLRERVNHAIRDRIDLEVWHRSDAAEAAEQESLVEVLSRWPTTISRRASEYGGRS